MRKKQWMIALNLRTLIREYENTVDCGHNPWCGFNIHFYLTSIFMASTNFLHSCNKKSKFIQKLHLFCKTFPNFTWPQFKNQKRETTAHSIPSFLDACVWYRVANLYAFLLFNAFYFCKTCSLNANGVKLMTQKIHMYMHKMKLGFHLLQNRSASIIWELHIRSRCYF